MREIGEPDDDAAEDTAEELRNRRRNKLLEGIDTCEHLTEGDGRV